MMTRQWIKLSSNPYQEVAKAQLVPGDGIAKRVTVFCQGKALPQARMKKLILIRFDEDRFVGRDIFGQLHVCSWDQAVAYLKTRG